MRPRKSNTQLFTYIAIANTAQTFADTVAKSPYLIFLFVITDVASMFLTY